MLNIITTISPERVAKAVQYLEENIVPQLGTDVSNYAPGRSRVWFPYEAPLSETRDYQLACQDDKIWTFVKNICSTFEWEPELGLVSKGGTITPHRDAAYADFRSIGINLGRVTWCYSKAYPMYKWVPEEHQINPPEITKIEMTGGEVFEFNCKNLHWTEDVDPDRWAFNLWRISTKGRPKFESFLNQTNILTNKE
jgi:hypothetical protein